MWKLVGICTEKNKIIAYQYDELDQLTIEEN